MKVLVLKPLKEFQIGPKQFDRNIQIGFIVDPELRGKLIILISANLDCFAWSSVDMIGIDIGIIAHKLEVDPKSKLIKQKRRKYSSNRNQIINEEALNLWKNGMVQ